MKFTVDRKTWFRGKPEANLLMPEGMRCCIGFVAKQCGVADDDLLRKDCVSRCSIADREKFPPWLRDHDTAFPAYEANDDKHLSDEQRESALQEIFLSNGDEIEFVG